MVWLNGLESGKPLIDNALCQGLAEGSLTPACNVLCPWRRNEQFSAADLRELIAYACPEARHITLVGHSLGADKCAELVRQDPKLFDRVCLISNYKQQWDKTPEIVQCEVKILVGSTESSGSHYLPWFILTLADGIELYRVDPYKHNIGNDIWYDDRFDVLGWLSWQTDDIYVGDEGCLGAGRDQPMARACGVKALNGP